MSEATHNHYMPGHLLGGRYMLLTRIAQGGMGEVWKARDKQTGHIVAAKVLRPELSGHQLPLSRLRIEARNAMRIEHPNIASVLDSGEAGGYGWIMMELVEGRPLTDYLRGGRTLEVRDIIPMMIQVAMALHAAAAAGVVHRDIKPANILIRPDGVVKLTDFGISRTADQAALTAAGMVMGTAQYLPPEQAMGEVATTLGDLYALGVIAYEAASGKRPFTGKTQVDIAFAHVNDPVPPLPSSVPEPFARIVMKLLEKNPKSRPQSGAALARELVQAAHTLHLSTAPRPLPALEITDDTTAQPPVIAPSHQDTPATPAMPATPAGGGPALADATTSVAPVLDLTIDTTIDEDALDKPLDPRERRRRELVARLKQRAEERQRQEQRQREEVEAQATAEREREAHERRLQAGRQRQERQEALRQQSARATAQACDTKHEASRSHSGSTGHSPAASTKNRASGASTAAHTSGSSTDGRPRVRWHAVDRANARNGFNKHDEASSPTPTRFNRSQVSPPLTRRDVLGRALIIALIFVTIVLIVIATLYNRFGSLSLPLGMSQFIIEEAHTWPIPWPTV